MGCTDKPGDTPSYERKTVTFNKVPEVSEWHVGHDPVEHPSHYTGQVPGIECKDVIGWFPGHVAAAMKYLWRHADKGDPIENLRKAKKFIDFEIERLHKIRKLSEEKMEGE